MGTGARTRPFALAALAAAAFVFVTSETLPVGLLPQISAGLSVSAGRVGLLLTCYAALAAVTAIPVTAWTTHLPRHRLILLVIAIFVVAQFAAAVAPGYWWLVAARLLCATGHGLFWSMLAPIAARLAPPGRSGRATATVFVGNSLALVAGVPVATYLGQAVGWRWAFAGVGLVGAVVLAALWRVLPALPGEDESGFSADLLRRVADRRLRALYAVTVLVVVGHFAAYSYLAPLARVHGGFTGTGYSVLLLGYGAAGLLSVTASGPLVDRHPRRAVAVCLVTIAAALGVVAAIDRMPVVAAVVFICWGGAFTALPVVLQAAVLRVAPAVADVASAVYVVAFQIGIGGGAALGGALVDAGHLDLAALLGCLGALLALAPALLVRGLFPPRAESGTSEEGTADEPAVPVVAGLRRGS